MSLKQWADNGWLRPHETSAQEIAGLLAIVERDLADAEGDIEYLDTCRIKRNTAEYNMAGVATKLDASELADFVKELRDEVLDWLKKDRAELIL